MSSGTKKLRKDLKILEAMANEMDDYLRNETMFWPLNDSSMPRLTLGGYLMRQNRLTLLRGLFDEKEQDRLDRAIDTYHEALVEKVVRFEQHAHDELHARLRQWSEYLRELNQEPDTAGSYYASAVETRVMIAALLEKLDMPPYQLDERVLDELGVYDRALKNHWLPDGFLWPGEWQPAYPPSTYWWLYGRPRSASGS